MAKDADMRKALATERSKDAAANSPGQSRPARTGGEAKERLQNADRRNPITPAVREREHSRNLDKALQPSMRTGREFATSHDDRVAKHYSTLTQAAERVMARKDELKRQTAAKPGDSTGVARTKAFTDSKGRVYANGRAITKKAAQ